MSEFDSRNVLTATIHLTSEKASTLIHLIVINVNI